MRGIVIKDVEGKCTAVENCSSLEPMAMETPLSVKVWQELEATCGLMEFPGWSVVRPTSMTWHKSCRDMFTPTFEILFRFFQHVVFYVCEFFSIRSLM